MGTQTTGIRKNTACFPAVMSAYSTAKKTSATENSHTIMRFSTLPEIHRPAYIAIIQTGIAVL